MNACRALPQRPNPRGLEKNPAPLENVRNVANPCATERVVRDKRGKIHLEFFEGLRQKVNILSVLSIRRAP